MVVETNTYKLSKEEIDKKVRATIKLAYENIPFYRKKFKELQIDPESIRGVKDLEKAFEKGLYVTKKELSTPENWRNFHSISQDPVIYLSTGGYSGRPFMVPYNKEGFRRNSEVCSEYFNLIGIVDGDRILSFLAPLPYSSGILMLDGVKNYKSKVFFLGIMIPLPPEYMAKQLEHFKPNYVYGLPTRMEKLGKSLEEYIRKANLSIKGVGVGGESLSRARAEKIKEYWNADKVINTYASTEASIMAAGVFEESNENGLQIIGNHLIFRVADLDKREIKTEGEWGNDLITTLYDETYSNPQPIFINYSHRDLVRFKDENNGIIDLPMREDEMISVAGVKFYVDDIKKANIRDYFAISKKDELIIRVVPAESGYGLEELKNQILDAIYSTNPFAIGFLGNVIKIEIVNSEEELYKGFSLPQTAKKIKVIRIEE